MAERPNVDLVALHEAQPTVRVDRLWEPAARAAARLELVADEEPGSMQHFTTVLLVGDLLTRLHAAFLVSVLAEFDKSVSQRLSFSLVRTSGAGEWLDAVRDCATRLRRFELSGDLYRLVTWPISKPELKEEREVFAAVAHACSDLAAALQHGEVRGASTRWPRSAVFNLLVEIRNKTVHGAYESRFYSDHVSVIEPAVWWIIRETPLWDVDLVYVTKSGQGRVLRGLAPTRSAKLKPEHGRDEVVFLLGEDSWLATPLIQVQGGNTYVANGSFNDSRTTAEFLCHSLAAVQPGEGIFRVALPDLVRPPLPGVGQTVDGQYRIDSVLGEGKDAVLYLASHTKEDAKYVLKAFREPKEAFELRRTEFQALERINHPGVPRVHEVHSWEAPYHLRLDYVPGISLEAKRNEFSGDLVNLACLGVAVGEALGAVHAAGFVHRDVAPDNIFIPEDPNDPIRLVDFDRVAPIGTVGLAGTSIYRPPESEFGAPWTEASDVYSLGAVLFELLTGRFPYDHGEHETDRRSVEPTQDEIGRFGKLPAVLLRSASLDPDSRYRTVWDFLRDFREVVPDDRNLQA